MALNRLSLPLAAAIMMINASLLLEGCLEEERIALLQIKTSIFDPNQNHFGASQLLSWGNDTLCSSWTGVSCDPITGRVNKIVLYNVRDFDSLSKLEELDLSGNEIQNFVTSTGMKLIKSSIPLHLILSIPHDLIL
ncbi:PROTEIN KINASE PLANT-TYPE putative-RELATED [Salix viminalis]|uniref:PROTEIN KINASE PLANT-TYPE putative-RELATED n=1 Tax=Salix viminalis TaxID=40686 RepID=A0A9Q0NP23_SALVM|nr:PROTEIN KINASE PLANT-TYPE putative-RELATED [Salix viminalis]